MQEGRPKVRWLTPDVVKVTVDLQCEKDPSARLLHAPYQTWTKEEKEKLEKKKAATPEASAAKKLPSSVTASTDEETPAKRRKIETPKEGKRPGEGKPWELKEKNHRLAIIVPYRNQPEQNRLPQLEEFASVMPVLLRKVRRFSVAWATSLTRRRYCRLLQNSSLSLWNNNRFDFTTGANFYWPSSINLQDGYKFNRGKLLNIGFDIASKLGRTPADAGSYTKGVKVGEYTMYDHKQVNAGASANPNLPSVEQVS